MRAIIACMVSLIPVAAVTAADAPKLPAPETELETAVDVIPNFPLAKIEMVKIPAGCVEVPGKDGAEAKKVDVKSIWIGRTELTWDAYDPFWMQLDLTEDQKSKGVDADNRPSKPYGAPDRGFGHEGYPTISVTSNTVEMYCKWLSAKTGKKYRLPTQAEWIYAAQAGKPAEKVDKEALKKLAWYDANSESAETGEKQTHPVAKLAPNAWGLYDTLGNAAEWVTTADGEHVVMGGSYEDKTSKVQTTASQPYTDQWQLRDPQDPKSKWWLSDGPHISFRIVRED